MFNVKERYLKYAEQVRRFSQNSLRAQRTDLNHFFTWLDKQQRDYDTLSKQEIRCYLATFVQTGKAHATQARHLSTLMAFYGWAEHEGLLETNPCEGVNAHKRERKLPSVMTQTDLILLFQSIVKSKKNSLLKRAFFELLYATGARIAELSALNIEDIDWNQHMIKLFGKGSKERLVPVYPEALDVLRNYLLKTAHFREHTQAVFVSPKGKRYSADSLRHIFQECVRAAGLPTSITPHTMRHTFATELLNGGADLRSVQELLGHVSLSTTQIYTHLSLKEIREVAKRTHPRSCIQD